MRLLDLRSSEIITYIAVQGSRGGPRGGGGGGPMGGDFGGGGYEMMVRKGRY